MRARIPAESMFERLSRTVLVIIAALAIIAIVVGFLIREPIERALVLGAARSMTGLDIDAERIGDVDGGYRFENVRVRTAGGAALATAAEATARVRGNALDLELDRPQVAFDALKYRDADRATVRDAFSHWHDGASATIAVHDGTLAVKSSLAAGRANSSLVFTGVEGTVHAALAGISFDGVLDLLGGAERYRIAGSTTTSSDGSPHQHWHAAALPLAVLDAFVVPQSLVHVRAGVVRDLDLDDGLRLTGSVHLDGIRGTLGTHAFSAIRGILAFGPGALGTRRIVGRIDDVPFDAAGEVHDLGSHYAWLRDGSRDLGSLATLAATLAGEPKLRSLSIEADAPGLTYAQYAMMGDHGPLAVSVMGIDPREPTLHFDTALAEDHLVSGGERTSAMGLRTHAVGGVNGDYFDIGRTYQPQGMLVRDGSLLRGPTDRAALAIAKNGAVTFAEFHLHGTVRTPHGSFPITEFNDWPPGHVSIITPDYGKQLRPAPETTFVGLEAIGISRSRFRVTSVEAATGTIAATFGIGIGKLERGTALPHVGETISLDYRTDPSLEGATAAIGGGPILVRSGVPFDDPHAPAPDERDYRWPVIALAQRNDAQLMLVAVDGRHPERSVGMTRPEFSDLLVRLGATGAMALDSGGSVTLVSRAPGNANVSVRNVPSDNSAERWVSDALFLYSTAPAPSIVPVTIAPTPIPEVRPSP